MIHKVILYIHVICEIILYILVIREVILYTLLMREVMLNTLLIREVILYVLTTGHLGKTILYMTPVTDKESRQVAILDRQVTFRLFTHFWMQTLN